MSERLSANTIMAWARLVRVTGGALATVEQALDNAGLPPLVWYDVLHELALDGTGGLRPATLLQRMLLAQYNLSRLLSRMATAGVVSRRADPEDGRAQIVSITSVGRQLRRDMWAVYGTEIDRIVGARLTPLEAHELARLLGRLE